MLLNRSINMKHSNLAVCTNQLILLRNNIKKHQIHLNIVYFTVFWFSLYFRTVKFLENVIFDKVYLFWEDNKSNFKIYGAKTDVIRVERCGSNQPIV